MLTWSTTLVSSLRLLEFAPVGFELSDRTFAKPNTAALNQALRFLLGESLFRAGECWPAETSAQRTAFRRAAQAALARLEASGDMPPGSSQASRLVSAGGPRVQQLLCFLADYRLRARLADVATATATAAAGGAQDEAAYGDGGEAEADAVEARTAAAAADPALLPLDSTALALRLGCDRARAARAAQRLRGRLAEALAEERSWAARDAQLRAAAAESVAELDRLRVARGELWRGGGGGGGGGDGDGDKQEEEGEEEAVRLALSELGALRRSRRVEGLQAAWAALAQHAEGAGGTADGGGGDGASALAAQDAVLQTVVGAAAAAAAVEASTAVGAGAADQAAAVPDLAVRLRAWAAGTEVVARALGDGAQTSDCPLDSWGSQLERLRSTATAAAAQAAQLEQLEVACEEQKAATADSVAELRRRVAALLDDADGGGDGSDRENSMASAQPSLRSPSSQPRRQQQQQQQQQLQQRRRQCRRDGAAARAPPSAVERRALAPATPAAGPGSRTAAHYAHYRSQTDRARSTVAAPSQPSPSPPPSPADTAAFDRLAKLVAKRQQKGWGSAH